MGNPASYAAERRSADAIAKTNVAAHSRPLEVLIFTLLLICGLIFTSASALGESAGGTSDRSQGFDRWTVESVVGNVTYFGYTANGPVAGRASAGMALGAPVRVRSGADSGALLTNGHDRVTMGPLSEIQLPADATSADQVIIVQYRGTARYDVESRRRNQERSAGLFGGLFNAMFDGGTNGAFQVHTPYLIAAVKGTSFDVTVGSGAGSVEVHEGVVEVSPRDGAGSVDLVAGQKAAVVEGQQTEVSVTRSAALSPDAFGPVSPGPGSGATASLGEPVSGTTETLGGTVEGTVGTLGGTAEGTVGALGGTVEGTGGALGGTVEGAVGALGGTVEGTVGALGGTVEGTVGALGGTVEGTVGDVDDAVGDVGSTLGDVVGSALGAVGDLLGGGGSSGGSSGSGSSGSGSSGGGSSSGGSSGGDSSGSGTSGGDTSGSDTSGGDSSGGDSSGGDSSGGDSSGGDSSGGGSSGGSSRGGLGDAVGGALGGVRDALGGLL
ncbi:MAG: FecR domain-containing protein, partial [Kiloniellales bacterium]